METAPASSEAFIAESAQAWEHAGLLHLERKDRGAAIPALRLAICYGSAHAMLWLAFAVIDDAYANDDIGIYFVGLGWLYIATMAGVPNAEIGFRYYFELLTDDLRQVWLTDTPYSWAGFSLN